MRTTEDGLKQIQHDLAEVSATCRRWYMFLLVMTRCQPDLSTQLVLVMTDRPAALHHLDSLVQCCRASRAMHAMCCKMLMVVVIRYIFGKHHLRSRQKRFEAVKTRSFLPIMRANTTCTKLFSMD